jgi:hypothetical protein
MVKGTLGCAPLADFAAGQRIVLDRSRFAALLADKSTPIGGGPPPGGASDYRMWCLDASRLLSEGSQEGCSILNWLRLEIE